MLNKGENLQRVIDRKKEIEAMASEDGLYLNLGCGAGRFKGFINIDKYCFPENVVEGDMLELDYGEETADIIYCSHAIEHLSIRKAKLALLRWCRILKKGGKMILAVPDLGEIMQALLTPNLPENSRRWYMFCLFGYQVKQDVLINDRGLEYDNYYPEYHTSGYTKESMRQELEAVGLTIDDLYGYDGFGTPSMWVEAHK